MRFMCRASVVVGTVFVLMCWPGGDTADAAAPWEEHGELRVAANGRYLEYRDGSPFFYLGDTAWRIASLSPGEVDTYLENRRDKGFTVIQFTANSLWWSPNYRDEFPLLSKDPLTPNPRYWAYLDEIIEKCQARGLHVCLFTMWGEDADSLSNPLRDNYEYGHFLGKRYRDQKHVMFSVAGEFVTITARPDRSNAKWGGPISEAQREYLNALGRGLRDGGKGNHLITIHGNGGPNARPGTYFFDEQWCDFLTNQGSVLPIDDMIQGDYNRHPPKPTHLGENSYEGIGMYGARQPLGNRKAGAWITRFHAYWSVFMGGFGYTYGHWDLWHMNTLKIGRTARDWTRVEPFKSNDGSFTEAQLNAEGAGDMIHLKNLMLSESITSRVPDQSLITPATRGSDFGVDLRVATRGHDRTWAFVYSTKGDSFTVIMNKLAGPSVDGFWYNPRSGKWHVGNSDQTARAPYIMAIPSGPSAPNVEFNPPGSPAEGNDWVLILNTRSTGTVGR